MNTQMNMKESGIRYGIYLGKVNGRLGTLVGSRMDVIHTGIELMDT